MADVTRWIFHPDDAVNMPELDPDGRLAYQGPFEYVPLADHLAELERMRVETLREARAAVAALESHRYDDESSMINRAEAIELLGRLINAATTGDTND